MASMKAAIVGIAGPALLADEAALFRAQPPAASFCSRATSRHRRSLRLLTADLRRVLPPNAVLMVDQEGGRVARLRPPHWRAHPPAAGARDPCRSRAVADRRADRAGLRRCRLRPGRRTGARPGGTRCARGHRRPCAGRGPCGPSARLGRAVRRRPAGRGHAADRQACAGPWPRPGGQSPGAAAGRGERPRCRPAAVRLERRPALGHVGAYRLSCLGCRRCRRHCRRP